MSAMFLYAVNFNQDISAWNVANVISMNTMFAFAINFNQNIGTWNVANVTDMVSMFNNARAFNQDISVWDVSKVTNMSLMFKNALAFNSPLNWGIKTANVTNMSSMFYEATTFNQDLSGWDVSSVTTMQFMFFRAHAFNSPINWGTTTKNVTDMSGMFKEALLFNQDISSWDISKVKTLAYMFRGAKAFNQDLSSWNVINVTDMSEMFYGASFNSPLNWGSKTANVTNMRVMFFSAGAFNQDLGNWDISSVTNMADFLKYGKLSRENYDKLLVGWSTLDAGETKIPINLRNVDFGSSKYSNAPTVLTARNTELISSKGWTITDGGMDDDVVLPEIVGHVLAADNASLSVSFSENVYRTDLGKGTLEITDFLFSLSGGTATLNTTIPTSISTSDNLTFVLGIGIDGTPNGAEALTVTPVLDAIFDISGNIAATSQNNNTTQLNDSTAPVITGPGSETGGNSVVTMNENTTAVHTFSADGTVTWSLGSINDEALFGMDSSGNLVFTTAPDYETPSSILNSNTYVVEVIATDAANNSSIQSLSITVADIPKTTFGAFAAINKQYFAGPHTIVPPTTNNSNPIVYASDNIAVATISGTVITFTGIGTATITATQAADANNEGGTVSTLLSVLGKDLVSKYGGVSSTASTFADANGKTGGALGLDKYGGIQNPYEDLVTSGLILHLDAGNPASYSGTGSVWTDISGNDNDGTLVNGVGYSSANNGALVFDGVNDSFSTPLSMGDANTSFSWGGFVKVNAPTTTQNYFVFGNYTQNGTTPFFAIAFNNSGDNTSVYLRSSTNSSTIGSSTNLDLNTWYYLIGVRDAGENQVKLYVNGELMATDTFLGSYDVKSTSNNFGGVNHLSNYLNCNIGQVHFYNRALTTEEIQQNYNTVKSIYGL